MWGASRRRLCIAGWRCMRRYSSSPIRRTKLQDGEIAPGCCNLKIGFPNFLRIQSRHTVEQNVIGAQRASWRIISSIEQKEENRGNEACVSSIKEYLTRIETELSKICDGILKLLDSHLVPSATAVASKVFYLKMNDDYHRYLAEFKAGAERKEAAENTLVAYKSAQLKSLALVNESIASQSNHQTKRRSRSKKQYVPGDGESQATCNI